MKKSLLYLPMLLLFACGGAEDQAEEEEAFDYVETEFDKQIATYLEDKDWKPKRKENGLYVFIEEEGSEEKPKNTDYLKMSYEGYLLDGTLFDGTQGKPVSFPVPLTGLVEGWKEGIPSFGKGGSGKLIIPPSLGYGDKPVGPIPANSVLIFDIKIFDFSAEPAPPELDRTVDYSAEIDTYISENKIEGMVKTESGLYVQVNEEGSTEKPDNNSYLTLNYEGYLLNGESFDGTNGTPTTFPFPLVNTIYGWQEGIPYFGKGGSGKLIIPPYMGYGPNDAAGGKIPGNSVLVFDFEIIDFTNEAPQPNM